MSAPLVWLPLDRDYRNLGTMPIELNTYGSDITFTGGKLGKAATYPDGTTSCLYMDGLKQVKNFTWCCWFKAAATTMSGANRYLMSEARWGTPGVNLYVSADATTITSWVGTQTETATIQPGQWYHVSLVVGDGKVCLYLNGEQVSTGTFTQLDYSDSGDTFAIGKMSVSATSSSTNFDLCGQICDVRIYGQALSVAEIKEVCQALYIHYKLDENAKGDLTYVKDSSGFENNGTALGTLALSTDSMRYGMSTSFDGSSSGVLIGNRSLINIINGQYTVAFWVKSNGENAGRIVYFGSYTSAVNVNFEKNTSNQLRLYWNASPDLVIANPKILDGSWTHIAFARSSTTNTKVFVNGELVTTLTTAMNVLTASEVNWRVGRDSRTGTTVYKGLMSDFRLYATALSDADIKTLYNVGLSIDKNSGYHAHEYIEDNGQSVTKRLQLLSCGLSEFDELAPLRYDPNTYIEPDGSAWVRIFHHNNPASGSNMFSNTSSFATAAYVNQNAWFNVAVCNQVNAWELMIKQKPTSSGTESKYRWIQTKNPMTAAFADVGYASITRVLTDGYSSGYVDASNNYGGLYKLNSNTYLSANNTRSGSWWSATGSWTQYSGGIPGYAGQIVSSGYLDLYLRIDNITSAKPTVAKMSKSGLCIGREFIER